ncbi:phosphoribosylformimino-5-aminoimidazole carboxamide ribotide isomerase [Bathymodiolus platifrons methanotrophic gill symbiont]|uniref:HisA/HisF-related TIM barrel protein n=1 Tax=Bathymodiolus platifrons methanotrophic gill symbiont TaxID=113268 RepID=UPI000B412390|nr:HisA/HisF-related TIM barrel protein [Bathymodiolus platifrons methanotrophic gill symbiont]MCK5869547.1 nickel transporter [Methyloprofundus sp.]TXK98567.1 nickel transporter [Methylococcaceae bacterium CS4]TXL00542.1 nickel transporter [Methylococcaceae bacterium CS5]TXL05061.1 nickel transporter [Methylococcaceae bacterium CS3]TXL07875.1 nickel transporter [Methylococcaceae bacterium CS1]TXL11500.1 nickel transporter [Methylococcaceae bacterium CS2]TXL15210.1 nickel transporter [Methyl
MQIIPVIDIKAGQVVLAQQGQRQSYQPLSTPLCHSSQIDDVIHAYLSIHPFTRIYIADLDALMKTGNNHSLINSLFNRYPQINFIIDSGSVNPNFSHGQATQFTPIIGTESIEKQDLVALRLATQNFILSLDFSTQKKQMGDPILYNSPELWPKQVIIMTLGLVGKNSGPDLEKLAHYSQHFPEHDFIAAGGIRNIDDLLQLKQIGIETALVASALHKGTLTRQNIQQLY